MVRSNFSSFKPPTAELILILLERFLLSFSLASCATTEMSNSGFAMHEDTHCPHFPELGNFDARVLQ